MKCKSRILYRKKDMSGATEEMWIRFTSQLMTLYQSLLMWDVNPGGAQRTGSWKSLYCFCNCVPRCEIISQ